MRLDAQTKKQTWNKAILGCLLLIIIPDTIFIEVIPHKGDAMELVIENQHTHGEA